MSPNKLQKRDDATFYIMLLFLITPLAVGVVLSTYVSRETLRSLTGWNGRTTGPVIARESRRRRL